MTFGPGEVVGLLAFVGFSQGDHGANAAGAVEMNAVPLCQDGAVSGLAS